MATVKFRLNVSSSTVGPDKLDFTVEKLVTVSEPMNNMSRVTLASGSDTVILSNTHSKAYMYFRNIDSSSKILIKNTANDTLVNMLPGQFAVLPVNENIGIEAEAATGTPILEYAYWTNE